MRMATDETGITGEAIAEGYLIERGFRIETTGYRYRRAEIDLIARKDDTLYFVEVKTRRSTTYADPSAAVSTRKEQLLARAASRYAYEVHHEWAVRFDVISIVLHPDGTYDLDHLEDVFFPGLH